MAEKLAGSLWVKSFHLLSRRLLEPTLALFPWGSFCEDRRLRVAAAILQADQGQLRQCLEWGKNQEGTAS